MNYSVQNFTNHPEWLQHGDEDLIEIGRKFADALDRQVKYKDDQTDNGPWSEACSDAFDCCDAAIKLRATSPLGVRIKAWLALYQCKVLCEITPAGEVDSQLVCSLLLDLVPTAQQDVPGVGRNQERIWEKFRRAA